MVGKAFSMLLRLLPLAALMLAFAWPAYGQDDVPPAVREQRPVIAELASRANDFERRVEANADNDERLVNLRAELEKLAADALKAGVSFQPRLSEINTRLEILGAAPAEGQQEPAEVTAERNGLLNEKSQINLLIGEAESTSIKANRLITGIADLRRQLFTGTLSKRFVINYALLGQVVVEFRDEVAQVSRTVWSWLRFMVQFKLPSLIGATFFALLAALVLLFGGRRLVGGLIDRQVEEEKPSYITRLSVAFWSTLLKSGALAVFLAGAWLLYDYFGVLRADIGEMLSALFTVVALVYFVHGLAKAVLSPSMPTWRLVAIEPHAAGLLLWLISATSVATGLDYLLSRVFEVTSAPLSLTVAQSLVATVIVGLLVILIGTVKPFRNEDGSRRPWPILFRYLLFLLGGFTIGSALLGFIGLSRFLSQQIVVTGAILATMYIGHQSARALAEEGAFLNTGFGKRVSDRFGISDTGADQLSLLGSILITLMVVVVGLPLILLQWGFRWADIRSYAFGMANEVRIGTVSFSFVGILSGIVVFFVIYFLTRWFQRWLDGVVLARGRVDAGVRNSIGTAVGYAGIAIAALIGISAAGINLSSLALVAGALSLGIGFGMQNVVSNFVSGLILLAERPFKVGDWIVAGAVSGTVRKISVRATEIETFQRQTVIMPNSELINAAVGNWTHKNKLGRVEIKIGVAYGSDARRVHEILTGIVREHPLILKNPEPFVAFTNFGESSLDFEVRLFLADVMNGGIVQNDIRFAILEAFEREGIDIPFPHRTLLIEQNGAVPPSMEPAGVESKPDPAKAAARKRKRPDPA